MNEVVYCSDCKKPVKSVPSWLAGVNVRFTCESCRQKHPRGMPGLEPTIAGRAGYNGASSGEDAEAPGELVEDEPADDLDSDTEEGSADEE